MGYQGRTEILRELRRSIQDPPPLPAVFAAEVAINADVPPVEPSPDDVVLVLRPGADPDTKKAAAEAAREDFRLNPPKPVEDDGYDI